MDTYKGVKLIEGRTKEMIDTIIEYHGLVESTKELAALVGIDNWRKLSGVLKSLYYNKHITKKDAETNVNHEIVQQSIVATHYESTMVTITKKSVTKTFTNYDGVGKQEARNLISEYISPANKHHNNILTLPAAKWEMEQIILNKNPKHKFTAVERDPETYDLMLQKLCENELLRKSVVSIQKSTINEVIQNLNSETYSHCILDYCGTFDTAVRDLKIIMERNLVQKYGYLAVTMVEKSRTKTRMDCKNNYSNKFLTCCNPDAENADINTSGIYYLIMNSIGYKLVETFRYKDTQNPMMLFILQRYE